MVNTDTFEWVELPSKGQCYPKTSPLRSGKVAVEYLTAKDENILVSERYIKEEKLCDFLLKNKTVDKNIDLSELCSGDKEALILWFRKTGYGNIYKIPSTENTIVLGNVEYKDFKMLSDDKGHFNYYLPNDRKVLFHYLSYKEEEKLIKETFNTLKDISDTDSSYIETYRKLTTPILSGMIISVDGAKDIKKWLSNMEFGTLRQIQRYITKNSPGLKLQTTQGVVFDDSIFYDINEQKDYWL